MRIASLQVAVAAGLLMIVSAASQQPPNVKESTAGTKANSTMHPRAIEAAGGSATHSTGATEGRAVSRSLGYLSAALVGMLGGIGVTWFYFRRNGKPLQAALDDMRQIQGKLESAQKRATAETKSMLTNLQRDVDKTRRLTEDVNSGVNSLSGVIESVHEQLLRHQPHVIYAGSSTSHVGTSSIVHPPSSPAPVPQNDGAARLTQQELGKAFVAQIKAMPNQEFSRVWEAFLAQLRPQFPDLVPSELYWDRTATGTFVEQQLGTFRDTGKCQMLQVGAERYLFFPELAASARKIDLPHCRIEASSAILAAENLLEYTPPRVEYRTDGCSVVTEGVIKYR